MLDDKSVSQYHLWTRSNAVKEPVVKGYLSFLLPLMLTCAPAWAQEPEKRPNVLLIGVDDLND